MSDCATSRMRFYTGTVLALEAAFDRGRITSYGGLVWLSKMDSEMALCEAISESVPEWRKRKGRHSLASLLKQRLFQIACGYEDQKRLGHLGRGPFAQGGVRLSARVLLAQVQADELRVRVVGGVMWLASTLSVTGRVWLGGVLQIRRERALIRALLERVRACGTFETLLLCTDGLAAYPKQALKVLREPLRSGKRGRPPLLLPEGVMVAQAIKRYARRGVTGVVRRIVRATQEAVRVRLSSTQGSESAVINTAYIERFQATLRSRVAPLVRRTRAAAPQRATIEAGMWLVGTVLQPLLLASLSEAPM